MSTLWWNPYADAPPALYCDLEVRIRPITIARESAMNRGTVKGPIRIDSIRLPHRSWRTLPGKYAVGKNKSDGSLYVSNVHNPIDLLWISVAEKQGFRFELTTEMFIDFEHERAGFRNVTHRMSFSATYGGLQIQLPKWNDPREANSRIPSEWGIPKKWNERTAAEFASRYVTLKDYTLKGISDSAVTYAPKRGGLERPLG